ncbi:MAG: hypothetical protein A2046_01115 [Bacteroidetes bacterium GWA2_30_7]|nr:MAG: hypothetical protein A2046_01115 [Bacteroidetes bacterium GWA2_30_7]
MRTKNFIYTVIVAVVLSLFANISNAQNGYEMKEGETIMLDENGKIIKSTVVPLNTQKYNSGIIQDNSSEKETIYNNDGSLKIPGYTPTGNASVDEQNYQKAKQLLYQNNPEEYKKWVKNASANNNSIKEISKEEFQKFPDNKKEYILEHPEKYYVEESLENSDSK